MLSFFLGLLTLNIVIIIHELGHFYEFRKQGIVVEKFGIGWPIGNIPTLNYKTKNGLTIVVSPIMLGGFVAAREDAEEKIKALSYTSTALISGAGIWANFISGLMVITLFYAYKNGVTVEVLAIPAILITLLFFFKKFFCKYLILPLGVAAFGLIIYSVFDSPFQAVQGPVGVMQIASKHQGSLKDSITFFFILSIALGSMNCLPILPLDGGQILHKALERNHSKLITAYFAIGALFFICLVAFALISDIINLIF